MPLATNPKNEQAPTQEQLLVVKPMGSMEHEMIGGAGGWRDARIRSGRPSLEESDLKVVTVGAMVGAEPVSAKAVL